MVPLNTFFMNVVKVPRVIQYPATYLRPQPVEKNLKIAVSKLRAVFQ